MQQEKKRVFSQVPMPQACSLIFTLNYMLPRKEETLEEQPQARNRRKQFASPQQASSIKHQVSTIKHQAFFGTRS